jgi:16S rRNA (guanine527-N7)-methyltransferase
MQMTEAGKQLLLQAAGEIGLNLQPHLPQFARLFELLTTANQTLNLTAIRDEQGIILKHFVDSLTCLTFPGFRDGMSVIDVGTGAGFPGLPLALVRPEIRFDLLDATQKKVDFVATTIQALKLENAHAIWGRSEELSRTIVKRETYDAAVTRAVATLQVVAELTLPLVRVGGFVLVQKATGVEAELAPAQSAIKKLGGSLVDVLRLELPIIKDTRNLVIIEKIAPTPKEYPRKAGVPSKNPLS